MAVRDIGLLASAAARPQTAVLGGRGVRDRCARRSAALLRLGSRATIHSSTVNKRLGWSGIRTFLLLNGHDVAYESVDRAERFVLDVAAGVLDVPEITAWLDERVQPADWPIRGSARR